MGQAAASGDAMDNVWDKADLASLYFLTMAPLPFERRALRRMRMIKNMRFETVIELFASHHTGSGQVTVRNIAANLGIEGGPDFALLRLLESLPSFDQHSVRIGLRRSEFPTPTAFALRDWQAARLDLTLSDFIKPLAARVMRQEGEGLSYAELVRRLRVDDSARAPLCAFAEELDTDADEIVTLMEDYADTVLSLEFYRQCLNQIMPPIEDMLQSVRGLRADCLKRGDTLQLAALNMVEATINEMIADVTGRIESFERSTRDIWVSMTREKFAAFSVKCRDYQASIANIICALAVKMNRWIQLFPTPASGIPVRRSSFIMSEMRQGLQQIRGLLGAAPIMAEDTAS